MASSPALRAISRSFAPGSPLSQPLRDSSCAVRKTKHFGPSVDFGALAAKSRQLFPFAPLSARNLFGNPPSALPDAHANDVRVLSSNVLSSLQRSFVYGAALGKPVCSFVNAPCSASSLATSLHARSFSSDAVLEAPAQDTEELERKRERKFNADEIGYRVVGRMKKVNKMIKIPEKDAFAVVQIGSQQFKVTPGDAIYTEKLLFADINDKLMLEKVLLIGSKTTTIIGRPLVPDAKVSAAVEEHALDAKVIIFKKKRRKNYRRHRGHRQELTRLRILNIVEPEIPQSAEP